MDEQPLLPAFQLAYRGNDAEKHQLDAVQAGKSIAGTARLYNSVLHFSFHGRIPARNYRPYIRTYTQAPRAGCLELTLIAATLYDQINAYPVIVQKAVEFIFPKLLKAIFASRTKQSAEMMKTLEIIHDQSKQRHAEVTQSLSLAQTAIGAIAADKAQLFGLVQQLTNNNRAAMAEMVSPIGYSCRTLTHFDKTPMAQVIDEPMAESMRSQEELEVGTQAIFKGIILGVDKVTGACRVKLIENGQEIRGKITDPALQSTHNIYTAALDTADQVTLTAKPILKNGELSKLFISDAK
jgi:hypothetical protein